MVTSSIRSCLLFYEGKHFPFSPRPLALGGQKVRAGGRLGMLGVDPGRVRGLALGSEQSREGGRSSAVFLPWLQPPRPPA